MPEPIVITREQQRASDEGYLGRGDTLAIQLWEGSAPGELHVHHEHDIAWHVLEGTLRFRFADREADAPAGATVFIPAGTPHTYGLEVALAEGKPEGFTRYLVFAPPRLFDLFAALQEARTGRPHTDWGRGPDKGIYARFDSELLEP